jgi:hypothetical protein
MLRLADQPTAGVHRVSGGIRGGRELQKRDASTELAADHSETN